MPGWFLDVRDIAVAVVLVLFNGFFVAAEFALVKVRGGRLELLAKQQRPFARLALWLGSRLDASLSACQLGITMASLGLGWIGEPAFADLLAPLLSRMGLGSPQLVHTTAFLVAFTGITALHLVVGEQAPKIFAIRRPELMMLWCAPPLAAFYFVFYPLLATLNSTTALLLRWTGLTAADSHESPHSEDEIRALVAQAHVHGELTGAEHRLIDAVFEFDDLICRRVMVPRNDVVFFDVRQPLEECVRIVSEKKHSRYPVCDVSLDKVLGVLHVKDLVGLDPAKSVNLRKLIRPPHFVPETMPVSRLLRHFQATHQLLAMVADEYGMVIGVVTLENVLEQIVGAVEDEFDAEQPLVTPEGPGRYVVLGQSPIEEINRRLGLNWSDEEADTISGLLMASAGRVLKTGDKVDLGGVTAEVLEVAGLRVNRVRLSLPEQAQAAGAPAASEP